ncbi:maleylpyruvate isomerase N-terminal domain-containing protein [Actinomycetospora callitridis]|uniref:maleylpyruvate isomerase N-terminal domain-containing protein n=1 Tax=Actinomycetospora callitridis TaxID=913944 RepID=UPI003B67DBA1
MDGIAEWTRAQERVIDLAAGLPAARASATVLACPDWTVRDLLSHMVGLGADVVAGDEPEDHNEAWTARQVWPRCASASSRGSRAGSTPGCRRSRSSARAGRGRRGRASRRSRSGRRTPSSPAP